MRSSLLVNPMSSLPPSPSVHDDPFGPFSPASHALQVSFHEIRYKDRPWSSLKTTKKIILRLQKHLDAGVEPSDLLLPCEGPDSLFAEYGFIPLKSYAPFVDAESLNLGQWIFQEVPASDPKEESDEKQAQDFYTHVLPRLKMAGWSVTLEDSFPFRPLEAQGEWYANLDKTNSTDWFDLELGMMLEGKRVNILPLLVKMLNEQKSRLQLKTAMAQEDPDASLYVLLDDGRFLPVPAEKIRFIVQTLIELHDKDSLTNEGKLRLSAWQSTQLIEIEAAMKATRMRWFGDGEVRVLGNKLKDFTQIEPVDPPTSLQCDLRPYQLQGIHWLQFLRSHSLNGILADDMGLGKTIQTLSHILIEFESGRMDCPVMVVAPTSLMTNWRMEVEKFAPLLKILVLHGNDRHKLFDQILDHHLILTTYPLLARDKEHLCKHQYHLLVLDEAQVIKNPNTMAHRIVQQIKARHRLCLTGTPMENHLGELWSLFYFLMPGFLGDQKKFNQVFRYPIEKSNDEERRQNLARRVKPFMLRRTKTQVVSELPPKTEIIQKIDLSPGQRALYESIRLTMHDRVQKEIQDKGLKRSQIVILDALLKLRQVCCDPRLLKLEAARDVSESAKVQFLKDTLPEMIQEKRQILLFSQFTSMLALIEKELAALQIPFVKLTGQTKDRAHPIQVFQSGQVPVFLISLKAGGTGLNLTAADTVIHFDPWWNPAVENQATDRAYRIGQDKPVFVYKLMTVGTVEEKIMGMQQRKSNLLNGIFKASQMESEAAFTQEDLEALFEPLG